MNWGFTDDDKGSDLVCISLVLAEANRYDCSRLEAKSEGLSLPGLRPARRQPKLYHIKNDYKQVCVVRFIWLSLRCQIFYFFIFGLYKEAFRNGHPIQVIFQEIFFPPVSGL